MRTNNDIKLGIALYSYQEAFARRNLDLEGILTAAAGAGAEGIEVQGETVLRSFPFISDEFLYKWFYMLDNLELAPISFAHYADRSYFKDLSCYLNDDELFENSVNYVKAANKLGCKIMRLSHTGHNGMFIMNNEPTHEPVNAKIFERLIPICEEYDVMMALEVHAPGILEDGGNDDFLEIIERTGTKHAKLMLDFSGCFRDDFPESIRLQIERGANPDCIGLIREVRQTAHAYKTTDDDVIEVDWAELDAKLKEMGAKPIDFAYAKRAQWRMSPPKVIKAYASKLGYIHGKVNWVNEDYTCDEMDYPLYINALKEGGYKGYISTEFEGQRMIPGTVNEIEQVRRHHVLLRNSLNYNYNLL